MPAKTRVKVDKSRLIDAIKARKEEAKKEHEKKKAKADAEAASYEMRVVSALEDALVAAKKGKEITRPSYGYKNDRTTHVLAIPDRPSKVSSKFDSSRYDRDIQVLEMSPEEVISLSMDDFERYVR